MARKKTTTIDGTRIISENDGKVATIYLADDEKFIGTVRKDKKKRVAALADGRESESKFRTIKSAVKWILDERTAIGVDDEDQEMTPEEKAEAKAAALKKRTGTDQESKAKRKAAAKAKAEAKAKADAAAEKKASGKKKKKKSSKKAVEEKWDDNTDYQLEAYCPQCDGEGCPSCNQGLVLTPAGKQVLATIGIDMLQFAVRWMMPGLGGKTAE